MSAPRYRRNLSGPSTVEADAQRAGVTPSLAIEVFDRLQRSLAPVRTPIGEAFILTKDVGAFGSATEVGDGPAGIRLLPSGDTYYLLQGDDRKLLVPRAADRGSLWTSRVWPGAVLVDGAVVGTWRRSGAKPTVQAWRRLSAAIRNAIEHEAESLPLPLPAGKPIAVA